MEKKVVNNNIRKRIKTRKLSVEFQIVIFVAALVLLGNLLLGIGLYNGASILLQNQVMGRILGIADNATLMFDGDEIEAMQRYGTDSITIKNGEKILELLISLAEKSKAEYIYIIAKDEKGEAYFVSSSENDPESIWQSYDLVEGMDKAFSGLSVTDEEPTTDEWGTFISGYAPILNSAGKVVAIIGVDFNYSDVKYELSRLRGQFIFLFVLIVFIMIVGFVGITRILRKGFNTLNDKINELADGTGDLNRLVELNTGNEFEVIADSINAFITEVKKMVVNVATRAETSAESLNNINVRVTELSANMEECSATTEAVSDKLNQTNNHVNEMSELMNTTTNKAKHAKKQATDASNQAISHKEKSVNDISQIQESIRAASEDARAVDDVKSITTQIEKIASESKILALNAQIEAARAGEAGRGFAVVAEEMGNLNNQIAIAVSEISVINDTVLNSVNSLIKGVKSMDDYLSENVLPDYDEYAALGKAYGDMTNEIQADIEELNSHAQMVSEEVSAVNSSIKDINTAVTESANGITEVNMASSEISEEMTKLTQMPMLQMTIRKRN